VAIAAALVLGLNGCAPNQAAIDQAVAATRTADSLAQGPQSPSGPAVPTGSAADQQALNAIETAVAATVAASQPSKTGPQVVVRPPSGILVAYVGPQTGGPSALFSPLQQAARMAIQDHGPVRGFEVVLVSFDDACTEAGGEAAAQKIVADERIVAVVGPVCSRSASSALPILDSKTVVMISGSATLPGLSARGPRVFHRTVLDDDQVQALGYPSQIYIEDLPAVQGWFDDFVDWGGELPGDDLKHLVPYQYDAMRVLLSALDLSAQANDDGSLVVNRQALRAAVDATSRFPGVTGLITFERDGDRDPLSAADKNPRAGVCRESMATLQFVSNGYLASGWFLVTLAKPGGFEAPAYTLLVNGQASGCSMLSGRTDRIYCTGPYVPPTGLIPIQLLSADSSCSFETPFEAMSVIPKPTPISAGTYY
jgi:ABC-type branched-subunit amino acid transport system substrate-binding protein